MVDPINFLEIFWKADRSLKHFKSVVVSELFNCDKHLSDLAIPNFISILEIQGSNYIDKLMYCNNV